MRQPDGVVLNMKLVVANGKPLVSALDLKAWILTTAFEEIGKRFTQILDGHLWRAFRHFQHPRICVFFQCIEFSS